MFRRIGVYLIGEELLLGKRRDKHLPRVIEVLAERDLVVDFVHMIGDDEDAIAGLLASSLEQDSWVISFGGIGATPDDRTRQAAAKAAGLPLEPHPDAVELIEKQFGEAAYPHRIRMADLPQGCELIPNAYNRIPGFSLGHHHFVPGFPQMAWDMLDWLLRSRYPDWRGVRQVNAIIQVVRAKESELVPVQELMVQRFSEVALSSLPRMASDPSDATFENYVELGLRGPADAVQAAYRTLCTEIENLSLEYRVIEAPIAA